MGLNVGHIISITKFEALAKAKRQCVLVANEDGKQDELRCDYRRFDDENVVYLVYPTDHYRFKWGCCPVAEDWLSCNIRDKGVWAIVHYHIPTKEFRVVTDRIVIWENYLNKIKYKHLTIVY